MGRLALVSAALLAAATACGSATSLSSATPLRNVIVYAKPSPSFRIAMSDTEPTIWRARSDGSHAKRLASGHVPAISPDGRWVAFGNGHDLLVMPAAGGAAERVYTFTGRQTGLVDAPIWAPDSRHVAFQTSDGLTVLNILSRQIHVVAQSGDPSSSFSPDSRKLAYAVSDTTGSDIYVVSILGGPPVRITVDHRSVAPVWGKPGIAFMRLAARRQGGPVRGDIWLSDGRQGDARQLTHTGAATNPVVFSADGRELLAANPATHNGRLWAVDVSTGAERPLTPWVGDLYAQGLSADGKMVLAAIGCGGMLGPYGSIETIPSAGGKPHTIVRGPCRASWNAG